MKQDEKKRTKNSNRFIWGCTWCILVTLILFHKGIPVMAAETAADMAVFQGVTVSPDGTAWTTDYLDTTNERLEEGFTVYTGMKSSLRELRTGEHYYEAEAEGSISIGKWEVGWPDAQCIHTNPCGDSFCGFPIKSDTICYSNYNNGWYAYCADCGKKVVELLFYAKSTTVSGITSMPANAWYLYICPHCQGLEQGSPYTHMCKAISYNHYKIIYQANVPVDKNTGEHAAVQGTMESTGHMYDNASDYNGTSAVKQGYGNTRLRVNGYSCDGYKFVGWNTRADGSGSFFEDGAEVINLTAEEGGIIYLYAQWEALNYPDSSEEEPGALYTKQLALQAGEGVYQESAKTYYVKADGVTEYKLSAQAYIDGAASQEFQIDSIYLHIGEKADTCTEWLQVKVPHIDIEKSSCVYEKEKLGMSISEKCRNYMQPENMCAERSGHGTILSLEQGFSVNTGGSAFVLYPQAMAELGDRQYFSWEEADRENGLTIIPDGTPPMIDGLDALAAFDVLDMTEQTGYLELKAEDSGSGLREFTVCVSNRDNFLEEEFVCDGEGRILLEINRDNELFVGEIVITASAFDRVGNANIIGEDGLTFTLETNLYKERNPEEKIFKTGDGAVLEIVTAGYVEKLEVVFPEELLQVNQNLPLVYEYEYPSLRNTETVKFSIPLGIPEQEYEITVRAYKNGEMLISKQTLMIVEGNVLDELRTRIRSNG